jgi:hypothetical protein
MVAPSLIEPALVWLHRGALDRRLAAGADPGTSPELARRARQLTSRRFRAGLAESIRGLLETAEQPRRGFTSAVPVQRQDILRERGLMLGLAADLVSGDQLQPRGIALVEQLLTHSDSPIYSAGDLHAELGRARAALHLG